MAASTGCDPAGGARTQKGARVMRIMLRGKIHRATVTGADLDYEGSLTVDQDLLDAADILPFEKVAVVNITNGARIETYTIAGPRGGGDICANGAAAHYFQPGDRCIVIAYQHVADADAPHVRPNLVFVDERNRLQRVEHDTVPFTRFSRRPAEAVAAGGA